MKKHLLQRLLVVIFSVSVDNTWASSNPFAGITFKETTTRSAPSPNTQENMSVKKGIETFKRLNIVFNGTNQHPSEKKELSSNNIDDIANDFKKIYYYDGQSETRFSSQLGQELFDWIQTHPQMDFLNDSTRWELDNITDKFWKSFQRDDLYCFCRSTSDDLHLEMQNCFDLYLHPEKQSDYPSVYIKSCMMAIGWLLIIHPDFASI